MEVTGRFAGMSEEQDPEPDAPAAGEDEGGPRHEHRPLVGYATLTSIFALAFVGSLTAARKRGAPLPERYAAWDVITTAAATQKLARLITRDKVTSSVRAPFVRYKGGRGRGEVVEEPKGTGLRHAVGELLSCPYCMSQWVAAAFGVGMVAAPRLTRLIAYVYSTLALADVFQVGYVAAEEAASAAPER